jgi:hypothetical protein
MVVKKCWCITPSLADMRMAEKSSKYWRPLYGPGPFPTNRLGWTFIICGMKEYPEWYIFKTYKSKSILKNLNLTGKKLIWTKLKSRKKSNGNIAFVQCRGCSNQHSGCSGLTNSMILVHYLVINYLVKLRTEFYLT